MTTRGSVSEQSTFSLVGERGTRDVLVNLYWHRHDPYCVRLEFLGMDTWEVSRELLADGLQRVVGEGDVVIEPIDDDLIELTLLPHRDGDTPAVLWAPRRDVEEFLSAVWKRLPPEASVHAQLDRWLRGFIGAELDQWLRELTSA